MTVKETTYEKSHLLVNRVFHPNSRKAKALHELVDNYSINNNISGGLMPIFNFLSHIDSQIEPRTLDAIIIKYAGPIEYRHAVNCKCTLCNARLKQGSRLSLRLYGKDGKIIKRAGAVKNVGSLGSIGELFVGDNHTEHLYNIAKAVGDKDFAKVIDQSRYKNEKVEKALLGDNIFEKLASGKFDERQLSYILSVVGDLNKARYDESVLKAFELPPINDSALNFLGNFIAEKKLANPDIIGAYQRFRSNFAALSQEDALMLNLAVYELHQIPTQGVAGSLINDLYHLKYNDATAELPDFKSKFRAPSPLGLAERDITIDEKLKEKFSTRAEIVGIYRIVPGMDKKRTALNRESANKYSNPQTFAGHFSIVKNLVKEQAEEYANAKRAKRKTNWFIPAENYRRLRNIVELAEKDRAESQRNNLIRFTEMRYSTSTFQSVYLAAKKQELGVNHHLPAMAVADFIEGYEKNIEKFKHTPFGAVEDVFYNLSGGECRVSEKYNCPFRGDLWELFADKNFNAGIVVGEQIKLRNVLKMYDEAFPASEEMKNKIIVLNKLRASPVNFGFLVNESHLENENPYSGDFYPHFNPEKFKDAKYLFPCHEASISKAYEIAEKAGLTSEEAFGAIEAMKGVSEDMVLYGVDSNGVLKRTELKDMFKQAVDKQIRYTPISNLGQVSEILGNSCNSSEVPSAIYIAKTWDLLEIKARYAKEFSNDVESGRALISEELKEHMMEFKDGNKYNKAWQPKPYADEIMD